MTIVDRSPLAVTDWAGARATKGYGDALTPRQRQILALLADGHTVKEICYCLHISKETFWNHVSDAKARIGAGTTVRAVVLFDRSTR